MEEVQSYLGAVHIILWARAAERLFIAIAALAALIMGWYLFRTGVIIDQSASGEFRGAKVVLTKVGPGVFFALFGTIVLTIGLVYPVQIGPDMKWIVSSSAPSKPGGPIILWGGSGTNIATQEEPIKVLNAIEPLIKHPDFRFPHLYPTTKIVQAVDVLKNLRDRLLIEKFGQDAFDKFVEHRERYLQFPQNYSRSDRDLFAQMEKIYSAEFE